MLQDLRNSTSAVDARPVQTVSENASSGPDFEPLPPSILTLEVKSVANRPEGRENDVLGRKLSQAAAHVKEARAFLPYVAQRDEKRAEKLESCGSWLLFNQYLDSGDIKLASGIFCQQPLLCGFCAAGRAARQVDAITQKISHLRDTEPHLRPYMVTLTMRSQSKLPGMIQDFWAAWSKMVQRRRNAKRGLNSSVMGLFDAGVIAGEAKRGRGGQWHYHAHGIILADIGLYKPIWERLKREWSQVLGQTSASIQFQPVKEGGTENSIREAVKYASKWEPGRYADRWTAYQALARVRRIRCFGLLHGLKIPEEVADDLSDLEGQEYLERAFMYGQGSYHEVPHARREPAFDEFNEKGYEIDC